MMKFVKTIVVASMAATALAGAASPAFARDECSGVYEIDGCQYCAYQNGISGYAASNCDGTNANYAWSGCGIWVDGNCIGGTFNQ